MSEVKGESLSLPVALRRLGIERDPGHVGEGSVDRKERERRNEAVDVVLAALAAAPSSPMREGEPVAWRWRWTKEAAGLHPDSPLSPPWNYTTDSNVGAQKEVEPLYAALSAPTVCHEGLSRDQSPTADAACSQGEALVPGQEAHEAQSAAAWDDLRREWGARFAERTETFRRVALGVGVTREELGAIERALGTRRTVEMFVAFGEAKATGEQG